MNGNKPDWSGKFIALAFFSLPVVVLTGFVMLVLLNVLEVLAH